jgi:hypothetical protein
VRRSHLSFKKLSKNHYAIHKDETHTHTHTKDIKTNPSNEKKSKKEIVKLRVGFCLLLLLFLFLFLKRLDLWRNVGHDGRFDDLVPEDVAAQVVHEEPKDEENRKVLHPCKLDRLPEARNVDVRLLGHPDHCGKRFFFFFFFFFFWVNFFFLRFKFLQIAPPHGVDTPLFSPLLLSQPRTEFEFKHARADPGGPERDGAIELRAELAVAGVAQQIFKEADGACGAHNGRVDGRRGVRTHGAVRPWRTDHPELSVNKQPRRRVPGIRG